MTNYSAETESPNIKSFNNAVHEKTESVANSAAGKTHDGIQKIGQTIEHIAGNAEAYNKEIADYVEKNPVKSLVIAGLAGMLVGMLLRK
jgi:ElaB/YqjD/DUF883 family membrane-anchored ribosome-binding protein